MGQLCICVLIAFHAAFHADFHTDFHVDGAISRTCGLLQIRCQASRFGGYETGSQLTDIYYNVASKRCSFSCVCRGLQAPKTGSPKADTSRRVGLRRRRFSCACRSLYLQLVRYQTARPYRKIEIFVFQPAEFQSVIDGLLQIKHRNAHDSVLLWHFDDHAESGHATSERSDLRKNAHDSALLWHLDDHAETGHATSERSDLHKKLIQLAGFFDLPHTKCADHHCGRAFFMSFTMDFVILKSNGGEQLQMNSLLLHFHGGVYAVLNFVREQLVWHNRWHDRWSSNSQPYCVLSFLSGSLHTPGTGSSGSYRKARYTVHQVLTWHAQVSSLHSERLQPLPSEHARVFFRASTDKPDAGAKKHQIMQRSSLCWGLRGRHWRFKYFHVLRRREVRCRKWSNIDFAYGKLRTQMTSELHKVMRSTIDFTVATERDQLCIQASSPTNTQTCDPQEAYNEHAHLSCRGPKSARWGLALLTFLSTFTRCAGVHHVDNVITLPEPRVATLTTGVAEASKFQGSPISRGAKSSGMQGQFGSGVGLGRIRKRAYRRACARATRNGGTYYRGRWMSDPHQGFAHDDQPAPTSSKQPTQQKHHGRHMRVMTYNAGGLGGGLYEELIHYARKVKIDILCVQESQWRFSSTWQVPGFRVVHSGHASTVKAGVMILIADALASQEQIRFEEIVEGRLLHARVQVGCQNIDILNLYQHALSKDADVYSKRLDLWRALAQCMHQIPERNQLIVMGDFNTTPTPQAGICGPGVWLKESKAKDVDELDTLLRVHRLCVLNSWSTSRPQITFEFGSIKSQLDLVITRRGNVTAISREATSLRDTQLAAWREGAKHFPVFAMIKVSWQPWWRQTQQKWGPQPNVLAMACAFSQSTPSEALTKFRNQVQASIPDKCTMMILTLCSSRLRAIIFRRTKRHALTALKIRLLLRVSV